MIRKLSGFSLLEVAIVLCIIGIISGIGIPALNNFLKYQKIRKTEDHIEQIIQSLASYVLTKRELWIRNEIKNLLKWDYSTD